MEKLILETTQRGVKTYHKLENFPVILGRGFDSDVIISDITVSPSHVKIDIGENGFEIQNLSTENGTRINGVRLAEEPEPLSIPARLSLGDFKSRLLAPDAAIAPTRIKSEGNGWFSFLSNPYWAGFFVIVTALAIAVGKYISTPVAQDSLMYLSKILPAMLLMLALALLIASVSRLSAHRWAFVPALSIASLFLLLPMMFEYIGEFMDYFLTADWPSSIIKHSTEFLLLPALLLLYLTRVHYVRFLSALGIAVLVTMPVTAFFVSDLVDQMSSHSGFTPMPNYNKSLSSLDIRLQKTMEVDEFLKESQTVLDEKIEKLLKQAAD